MMCIYEYSVQLLSKHYTTGEIEYTTSRTPRRRDGQYNIIMQSSAGADLSTYIIIIIICLFSYNTHTIFFIRRAYICSSAHATRRLVVFILWNINITSEGRQEYRIDITRIYCIYQILLY